VTALYQLVPAGIDIPTPAGAPPPQDGGDSADQLGVSGDDWVLVRVRYKQPDAGETDPAKEVTMLLRAEDVAQDRAALDADFHWALAVSAFAEVLKGSPYAEPERLSDIGDVVHAADQSRSDRAEFASLFDRARALYEANR
jgi:hypothetical protein